MKKTAPQAIEGTFQHLIYAPKGEIEGVLLRSGDAPVQVVIDKQDEQAAAALEGLAAGQSIKVAVTPAAPSRKGAGEHPVYEFGALEAVDGSKPAKRRPGATAGYSGKVVRFNYARHGQPNGVVLDSGDFIHTKPDGLAKLGLKVGDAVEADGDAQRLADDSGWAVEATRVNGKALK